MKMGLHTSLPRLALVNAGVAAVCVVTAAAVTLLPLVEALPPAQATPLVLAPSAAVVLAALLIHGTAVVAGSGAGLLSAALLARPDEPFMAIALMATLLLAAGWSSVYTRHAIGSRLTDLVLTLRGVGTLLGLTVGAFAVWTATLASLADVIINDAPRHHDAYEAALIAWAVPVTIASALLLPPVLLVFGRGWPGWRSALGRTAVWLAVAGATVLLFDVQRGPADLADALPFLLLPMLIAVGAWDTTACVVSIAVMAVVAGAVTVAGHGTWGRMDAFADLGPLAVILAAAIVTALPVAALMREHRAAIAALAAANRDLETHAAFRNAEASANERRLRQILDGSPAGVCVTRPDGDLLYANATFRAMFEVGPGEHPEGLDVATFFADPEDRRALLDRLERDGVARGQEIRYRYRGRVGWALEHAALVTFEGEPAVLAWILDITDRKAAEDALRDARVNLAAHRDALAREVAERTADLRRAKEAAEAANAAKSDFLANMSHELRTPLNAVLGFAQLIEQNLATSTAPDADRRRNVEYAANIQRAGGHLLAVINDILDMAQIDAGRMELTEERVDLAACIDRAAALTDPGPDTLGPKLVLDLPPRVPALRADRRRVEQMLVKLMSNGRRFTGPTGTVTVSVSRHENGAVAVTIADTGIGMGADDIRQALIPFQQVHGGLSRPYDGTGLGLPLVRALAALHGGTLEIDSTPGQGTQATITFPASRVLQPHALPGHGEAALRA